MINCQKKTLKHLEYLSIEGKMQNFVYALVSKNWINLGAKYNTKLAN